MRLEFDQTAWMVCILVLSILLIVLRKKGVYFLFFFSIFWVYLLALVSVAIFPIPLQSVDRFETVWKQIIFMQRFGSLNLIPLAFGNCWDLPRPCIIGIYENILMTIPFGFGINFIARLKTGNIAWFSLCLGVIIEKSQLVLDLVLGGSFRSVDVNDVLFNGLGVWLGFGFFQLFSWLFRYALKSLGYTPQGILAYIQSVVG
jgi:glycopeptide antibiotics resistance protein